MASFDDPSLLGIPKKQEMRRSSRIPLVLYVRVEDDATNVPNFRKKMLTQDVSKHGARLIGPYPAVLGQRLRITHVDRGESAPVRVIYVFQGIDRYGSNAVGLELLEPKNFWGIASPPPDWHEPLGVAARETPAASDEIVAYPDIANKPSAAPVTGHAPAEREPRKLPDLAPVTKVGWYQDLAPSVTAPVQKEIDRSPESVTAEVSRQLARSIESLLPSLHEEINRLMKASLEKVSAEGVESLRTQAEEQVRSAQESLERFVKQVEGRVNEEIAACRANVSAAFEAEMSRLRSALPELAQQAFEAAAANLASEAQKVEKQFLERVRNESLKIVEDQSSAAFEGLERDMRARVEAMGQQLASQLGARLSEEFARASDKTSAEMARTTQAFQEELRTRFAHEPQEPSSSPALEQLERTIIARLEALGQELFDRLGNKLREEFARARERPSTETTPAPLSPLEDRKAKSAQEGQALPRGSAPDRSKRRRRSQKKVPGKTRSA